MNKTKKKISRNAPCQCGSGKKYKRCCGSVVGPENGRKEPLMTHTTPSQITADIKQFISTLGSVGDPVYLPFTHTSDKYSATYCLSNCEAEAHFTGATIVFGWAIWASWLPSTTGQIRHIEAEFHSIVKSEGNLIDITPRVDGEELILFVPDTVRLATRINNRDWDTWANHDSFDGKITQTHPAVKTDLTDNKLF